MKRTILTLGAALLAAAASILVFVQPASAAVGLHIEGRNIVEANGQTLIMRGVNHPHVWYTGETGSFADIKAAGANTVRVVLGSGQRAWGTSTAADVTNVINLCKENRLICVLEVHDTTGYGEQAGAASLDQAADFWIGVKSALVGQENYVVINIGNEPIGNTDAAQWTAATAAAIQKMRANGFEHLLMVDGPNWGQDWQNIMRTTSQTVLDADTQNNTVLSIHMYSVYNTAASIISYLDDIEAQGWPLVIGEFGYQFDASQVDHATILAEAERRGLGYLAWSWSGNSDPILDMTVGFDASQLTAWGEIIVNGPNGLRATSREASIYAGSTTPTTPSTPTSPTASVSPSTPGSPTASPPSARACTAAYSIVGQWQDGFQGEVRVSAGASALTGWTVTWTFASGQSIAQVWNASVSSSGSTVTVRNGSYNGTLAAGASTTFGFLGSWTGSNSVPTLSCAGN